MYAYFEDNDAMVWRYAIQELDGRRWLANTGEVFDRAEVVWCPASSTLLDHVLSGTQTTEVSDLPAYLLEAGLEALPGGGQDLEEIPDWEQDLEESKPTVAHDEDYDEVDGPGHQPSDDETPYDYYSEGGITWRYLRGSDYGDVLTHDDTWMPAASRRCDFGYSERMPRDFLSHRA